MNWKNKLVMVTGSEGMIGKELVIQLKNLGARILRFDIKLNKSDDVRDYKKCLEILKEFKPEYIFHLFGVKGNPKFTKEKPVDFMAPMLQGDTNMILAAQEAGISKFLYTSSISVEHLETDKYAAWAKMTAEKLIEAMRIQYPHGTKYIIVRPSNVYGRFDDFNNPNAMVITNLIREALYEEQIEVWGSGYELRDFIHAKDVAKGMILAMEKMPKYPVNLCSGEGIPIRQIAKVIASKFNKKLKFNKLKGIGSSKRIMEINWEFKPEIPIEEGLKEVIEYAREYAGRNNNKHI